MIYFDKLNFVGESEKKEFVLAGEAEFEKRFAGICERAAESGRRVLTLSGPSCSGKTTASLKLKKGFAALGLKIETVSLDDFFLDKGSNARSPENAEKLDLDSEKNLDLCGMKECLASLFELKKTRVPVFDFKRQVRSGCRMLEPGNDTVFLLEGIQAVYPCVREMLPLNGVFSIYINVMQDYSINGAFFTAREARLSRRMVRDYNYRSAAPEFTFGIWDSVLRNERMNMEPYAGDCDAVIDSSICHELGILKQSMEKLLPLVPAGSKYASDAQSLAERYTFVPEIPRDYLPHDSLFREFVF